MNATEAENIVRCVVRDGYPYQLIIHTNQCQLMVKLDGVLTDVDSLEQYEKLAAEHRPECVPHG